MLHMSERIIKNIWVNPSVNKLKIETVRNSKKISPGQFIFVCIAGKAGPIS